MAYMCVKNSSRECDGCMECKDDYKYFCPICNAEVYADVYVNKEGEILGCENCVIVKDVGDVIEHEAD